MAMQPATNEWDSVTLSQDEFWYPYAAAAMTADSTFTPGSTTQAGGVVIYPNDARVGISFSSGDTVQFRLVAQTSGAIWREPR